MKRTAVAIVLAVAALAMLVSLVWQSRSLPLDVHLAQNTISAEIERIRDDFSTMVATLESAREDVQAPGEGARALIRRIGTAPSTLRPLIEQIPGGAAQRERLMATFDAFSRRAEEAETLARDIVESQSEFAANVDRVRDDGPRVIEQMRELQLDGVAGQMFQLVVGTLDFAPPGSAVPQGQLRSLLTSLRADPQVDANLPREVDRLGGSINAVLDEKRPIERQLERLASSSLPERAASLGVSAQDVYQGVVASREQARLVLSIYSVALLLAVGFIALRLQGSYRQLNRTNAELAQLNESLEQRVAERTNELTGALNELKESQVQLVQAEKMSSLGQLVAGISHEINTPLLYLANNAVLIQERLQLLRSFVTRCSAAFSIDAAKFKDRAEFQTKFIGALKDVKKLVHEEDLEASIQEAEDLAQDSIEGLEDLTGMAQSLKDFSRLDRAPVATFDVNNGLDKTLLIARNMVKHKAEIRKQYGDLPEIRCSPSQINQVFLNLVTNAAQAIEEQGEIVITTKRHDEDGDYVAISIADTGCGIPEDIIGKIRDPFFTTKDVGSGTGLGLSIVDEIIRSHGGELHVESEVGQGSVFTVILPVRPPETAEADGEGLEAAPADDGASEVDSQDLAEAV